MIQRTLVTVVVPRELVEEHLECLNIACQAYDAFLADKPKTVLEMIIRSNGLSRNNIVFLEECAWLLGAGYPLFHSFRYNPVTRMYEWPPE